MQLNARIKHKRDTASNWATKNPTPLDGEIIIVETTDGNTKVKVGDGSTAYNNLPFMNEDLTIQVSENTSNISTLTNTKVTGVTSATSGNVVVFDGTGGRLIKDSGKSLADYLLNEEILEATKRVSDVEVNQSVATIEALQTGLARVESNMISSVNGVKADASGNVTLTVGGSSAYKIPFGTCSTSSTTPEKVATITNGAPFSLEQGSIVAIKFSNDPSNFTSLNVNSSGAKEIKKHFLYGEADDTMLNIFLSFTQANNVFVFVFDGTYWNFVTAYGIGEIIGIT